MRNLLLCLSAIFAIAQANVIGFDFGSTFFKITLVKPGSPFSIVENTTSKRKTETMMTIANENRLWSADSFVGSGRFPKTTFAETASYMGLNFDQQTIDKLALEDFVLNDFVEDERGYFAFQTFSIENKDETTMYFAEEIVAMILKYGRTLSEN
jgi:hypoxia up-regulated 1